MLVFYFSGTGNSLYIAKRICDKPIPIPTVNKNEKQSFKDDTIGFVFPCYSFEVPRLVFEFILKNDFQADYFFAVASYGNMLGCTLNEFDNIAKRKNISINYYNSVLTIDNFLPLFSIEKQLKKEPTKKTEEKIAQIVEDINNLKNNILEKAKISHLIIKKIIKLVNLNHNSKLDKYFSINDNCNKCGICVKLCPQNNILKDEGNIKYLHNCCLCLSCIHNCPQKAIHLIFERGKLRYRNPHVKIEEFFNR
jgi:ferredoxin